MISSLRRFVQTARWGKMLLGLFLFVIAVTGFVPLAGCEKDREHKVRYHHEEREQCDRHHGEKGGDKDKGEDREQGDEQGKDDKQGQHEHEGEEDND